MALVIALAGKGGTGKTTIAGLTIRYIIERKKKPILAFKFKNKHYFTMLYYSKSLNIYNLYY